MRGIGLLVLLMGVALMFYLMFGSGGSVATDLKAKKEMEKQANSFSGRDENSVPVADTIRFDATDKGVTILDVTPGGAMEQKYGLEKGDVVVEFGPLMVKDVAATNQDAKGQFSDAYTHSFTLTVKRGPARLKLPDERRAAPVDAVQAATPLPLPSPSASPVQRTNPQRQTLDLLKKIESH